MTKLLKFMGENLKYKKLRDVFVKSPLSYMVGMLIVYSYVTYGFPVEASLKMVKEEYD